MTTTRDDTDTIVTVAKALTSPIRVRALRLLASGEFCETQQIADELMESTSAVAYHMRTLAGLGATRFVGLRPGRGSFARKYEITELGRTILRHADEFGGGEDG